MSTDNTDDTIAIIAWADNTWEYLEDYPDDWTHMSDYYVIINVPAGYVYVN